MSSKWPMVPLGRVVSQISEPHSVHTDRQYSNFGMYSFGRGLFRKQPIDGAVTSAKTLYQVRKGQFIYSRLFAFEGAYGLVTEEYDGHFVSNEYPAFSCDPNFILPEYLAAFFRSPKVWEEAATLSTGMGDRRRRIKPEQLLRYAIPLPPVNVQQHLVEQMGVLAAKTDEAKHLLGETAELYESLCRSLILATPPDRAEVMENLVVLRKPDIEVVPQETYHFAGVYCFGRGVFRGERKTGMEFAYPWLTRLRAGNFVYPKLMAWEGALAVVPPECDGLVVSTEFPVFEIDEQHVLPEVLDVYFRTPSVWPHLSKESTGTNVRRRRLNPRDFLGYRMPLPPMETQLKLREVKKRVDAIKSLKAGIGGKLDTLLPAILDRAFRGEL